MPEGEQRQYSVKVGGGRSRTVAALTPKQIELINRERPPSEQVAENGFCGARLSTLSPEGEPRYCSKARGYGTDHLGFGRCKHHGGNTAAGKKFGAREMGRSIIQERARAFGDKDLPENDLLPEQALLEEVRRSVALVRWLEERIGAWQIPSLEQMNEPSLRDALGAETTFLGGLPPLTTETFKGTPYATDVQSWLVLYREERAHMVKVSKLAIDAGIQERMVRIAENQGLMLATAIRAVLQALTITPEQQAKVPHVVPEILRQVASGAPTISLDGVVLDGN